MNITCFLFRTSYKCTWVNWIENCMKRRHMCIGTVLEINDHISQLLWSSTRVVKQPVKRLSFQANKWTKIFFLEIIVFILKGNPKGFSHAFLPWEMCNILIRRDYGVKCALFNIETSRNLLYLQNYDISEISACNSLSCWNILGPPYLLTLCMHGDSPELVSEIIFPTTIIIYTFTPISLF